MYIASYGVLYKIIIVNCLIIFVVAPGPGAIPPPPQPATLPTPEETPGTVPHTAA